MAYVIVDTTNRIKSIGGVVLTFDTEDAALASISPESSLTAGAKAMPLGEALQAERKMHADNLSAVHRSYVELQNTVEKFLEDGYAGAMDPDDFEREHEALAEAIGFEFTETAEYRVVLTVTVNKKRGYEVDDDNLAIEVESHYGDFTVDDFNIESIREQ